MINSITTTTKLIHWSTALGILCVLPMGFYMVSNEAWHLYHWHKSLGVLLLPLLVMRAIYRLRTGWPQTANQYTQIEHRLARLTHWLLLLGIIALPVSGMAYSAISGHGVPLCSLQLISTNIVDGEVQTLNATWELWLQQIHSLLGWMLAGIIALHVLGALKHHLIDRDATLRRMLL
jgi:cytochrome b561